ncbi:MAG: FtsX-like permease family protein, partial [Chitinophagaceae bacterium]
ALFILLIACINYMNLSTARSVLRAKEIGVRKVVGARRPELIAQFLSESVLLSWVATILALGLTWLTLPWLNELSDQQLSIATLLNWKIILPLLLVPFIVGVMSGIYPALFLSSFQPIKTLKGFMKVGGGNISFRKVLVVVQFSISIVLIIATAIAFRQLSYMQDKSLGFNKDHIVNLAYASSLNDSYEAFKTELLSNTNVQSVSRSSRIPSGRLLDAMGSQINHGDSLAPTKADIKYVLIDEGFVPTFGLKTVAGRNFSKDFAGDSVSFVVNEAAVKALGLKSPQDVLGKQFGYGMRKGQLIGVVNDFHFESLHQRILPMVFLMRGDGRAGGYGNLSIKISGNNIPVALAHIEKVWKSFLPEAPYDYTFLDNRFERLYETEQKQGTIFTVFSFIAIFIACLGLLGLSAFAISQRVKEIGIRKVLGADAGNIVGLLSKDFLKLVVIALVVAIPIAWYAMNRWLQDFSYRINIDWWVFAVAGVLAILIALITVSFQAIRSAMTNPVKNLRTE